MVAIRGTKVKYEINYENICIAVCIKWLDLINIYSKVKIIHKTLEIFYNTIVFLISYTRVKLFIR